MKPTSAARNRHALLAIKFAHTFIWVFFAGSIVALPFLAWAGHFRWAAALGILVLFECAVLALNGMRCPLTGLAARYTEDRSPNFDIYLPRFVAEYNKQIFGALFVVNGLLVWWFLLIGR